MFRTDTVTLWRPTGPKELASAVASGWPAWPPRSPARPPVRQADYQSNLEGWVSAEEPAEFNEHIVGLIEVVHEFRPSS